MNSRDSEALAGLLRDKGFILTDSPDSADVILFNTCSVRQHAEDKVWSEIGRIAKLSPLDFAYKTRKIKAGGTPRPTKKIVGLVGCMAQNYKDEIFKRCPNVDLVVGPNDLISIPLLIEAILRERSQVIAVGTMEREQDFYISNFRREKDHAYVVISEGCSNFCSYCVVPFVRGRLHSRPHQEILKEIKSTVNSGIKDITLLGQNVNAYLDTDHLPDKPSNYVNFIELIKKIDEVEGLKSFDFVTSHPKDTSQELFLAMRDCKKLKKQLHLPVQSGSDRILKLMNRGYTAKQYSELVKEYRKITNGRITTDIIVGFPTEAQGDFNQTLNLMKEIEFNSAYIFKYSPRPHTEAENLKDDVALKEKELRHKILLDLQKEISQNKKCTSIL
ncbi:MAG: tRNA (N6-isopentenyl adenosine(37)-C2)-methylthiotransferase MiaB [Candidatus Omnitrophota bacterium]|nr:tRNA (N6-isopentenyl adenosine(37)-C2)-methylthiotransferase MiaB [Candidatus Omnitrophota bacterium]